MCDTDLPLLPFDCCSLSCYFAVLILLLVNMPVGMEWCE